jgi:hypothetical protein
MIVTAAFFIFCLGFRRGENLPRKIKKVIRAINAAAIIPKSASPRQA